MPAYPNTLYYEAIRARGFGLDDQFVDDPRSKPSLIQNLRFALELGKRWKFDIAFYHAYYYPLINFPMYIALLWISPYARITDGISLGLDIVSGFILGGFKLQYFFMFNIDRFNPAQIPATVLLAVLLDLAFLFARSLAILTIGGAITAYAVPQFTKEGDFYHLLFLAVLIESMWYGAIELYAHGVSVGESLCHLPRSIIQASQPVLPAAENDIEVVATRVDQVADGERGVGEYQASLFSRFNSDEKVGGTSNNSMKCG